MPPKAGEVYWAGLDKRRLVIIVSREELNRGHSVTVVPVTSARFESRKNLPNCVPFRTGQFGVDRDCVAQAENTSLIDIADLDVLTGPVAALDSEAMRNIIRAIGYVIESECEPA